MRKRKKRKRRKEQEHEEKKVYGGKCCTIVRTSTPIEATSGGSHSSAAAVASSKEKFLKSNIDFIVTSLPKLDYIELQSLPRFQMEWTCDCQPSIIWPKELQRIASNFTFPFIIVSPRCLSILVKCLVKTNSISKLWEPLLPLSDPTNPFILNSSWILIENLLKEIQFWSIPRSVEWRLLNVWIW